MWAFLRVLWWQRRRRHRWWRRGENFRWCVQDQVIFFSLIKLVQALYRWILEEGTNGRLPSSQTMLAYTRDAGAPASWTWLFLRTNLGREKDHHHANLLGWAYNITVWPSNNVTAEIPRSPRLSTWQIYSRFFITAGGSPGGFRTISTVTSLLDQPAFSEYMNFNNLNVQIFFY